MGRSVHPQTDPLKMHISHLLHGFCHLTLSNEHQENAGTKTFFGTKTSLPGMLEVHKHACWKNWNSTVESVGPWQVVSTSFCHLRVRFFKSIWRVFIKGQWSWTKHSQFTRPGPSKLFTSIVGSGVCQKVHAKSKSFSRQLFSKMILKVVNTPRFGQFCHYRCEQIWPGTTGTKFWPPCCHRCWKKYDVQLQIQHHNREKLLFPPFLDPWSAFPCPSQTEGSAVGRDVATFALIQCWVRVDHSVQLVHDLVDAAVMFSAFIRVRKYT